MTAPGWPARLESQGVVVRALKRSDADEWQAVRARNHDWLRPWDATVPVSYTHLTLPTILLV